MSEVPYARVEALIAKRQRTADEFEMFVHGYCCGFQDAEENRCFEDQQKLEERVNRLFRNTRGMEDRP